MNFSTDRDLLALAPAVFVELPLSGQQRLRVTDGVLAGTTLSSASADFAAAGVALGSVVLVAGGACEVLTRLDAHRLTVSLVRARPSDLPIAPPAPGAISGGSGGGLEVIVRTFAPQAAAVHDELLRMLGIDPDDAAAAVTEDAIVSLSVMARLEALGTLARVYAAAVLTGDSTGLLQKAERYAADFATACRRAAVRLDTDGDGVADQRLRGGVVELKRV